CRRKRTESVRKRSHSFFSDQVGSARIARARFTTRADVRSLSKPSPSIGEGWVGVQADGFRFSTGDAAAFRARPDATARTPPSPALPPSRGKGDAFRFIPSPP